MTGDNGIICWEAHRGGGGYELPESTPIGFWYAWSLGGVPEADVTATRDGRLMSLHDGSLGRTARDCPEALKDRPIAEMTFDEVRAHDIGSDRHPGQVVPAIEELLDCLRDDPRKEIVIDYKNAPLGQLAGLIRDRAVEKQVTLATTREDIARSFRELAPGVRIKIWLGGPADALLSRFDDLAARGFGGFEQIQLHLNDRPEPGNPWRYDLSPDQVARALARTRSAGVLLQALPWHFDKPDLFAVLDTGVRSFAVDYPHRFVLWTSEYFSAKRWPAPPSASPAPSR